MIQIFAIYKGIFFTTNTYKTHWTNFVTDKYINK